MASNSKIPSRAMEKRISKSGVVTQDDIDEYIAQVGPDVLRNMGITPSNIAEYIKNIVELGKPTKKKKLPKKAKVEPSDSVVVANERDELTKVSLEDQKKDTADDKQGFRSFGDKLLGAGVFSFKKMLPTLGRLMDAFSKRDRKHQQDIESVNVSNKDNAQQVSRSSLLLSRIAETQLKTNELLEKIIEAAGNPPQATPQPADPGGPNVNIDLDRRRAGAAPGGAAQASRQPQQSRMSAGRVGAIAAGTALVGAGAYAAYRGLSGGGAEGPAADATRQTGAGQLRPESGTFRTFGAEGGVEASYSRTADGKHTIDDKEVDTETYNRFRQLSRARNQQVEEDPRYQRYMQESMSRGENEVGATFEARTKLEEDRRKDLQELIALVDRVRTQPGRSTPTQTPTQDLARAGSRPAAAQAARREESEPAGAGLDTRILNIKAKEIIFKADNFEFDRPNAVPGASAGAPPPVASTAPSGGGGGGGGASTAAVSGASDGIQTIVQRLTQDFPAAVVTSGLRPNSGTSQHASGNAVDLSLRGLSQDQRASLVQNLTSGKYGNVGGLGTYNMAGDSLHVDVRSGPKMAWGPNRSRTSLNETPQWFQQAVASWMGGGAQAAPAAGGGGGEQEPRPGGEQTATAAPSAPSSGAAVAQASVRNETAMMQSQQAPTTVAGAGTGAPPPSGSMEQTATMIDPNEPGPVEPADAAQRYARLFNIAA